MIETTATQKEEIAALCQHYRVRRLTWLHEPVRTGPDADSEAAMLIEFTRDDTPPLATLVKMETEISGILNRQTDLHLHIRDLYLHNTPFEGKIEYDRADYMEIPMPKDKIAEFCQHKKIRWLAKLPRPRRDSIIHVADVNFLAEFEPGVGVGWEIFTMGDELGEILGCFAEVDTLGGIEPTKLAKILESVEVQYERTH